MSKIFNLEEVRKKFKGYAIAFDDLPETGYKAMIYSHIENEGPIWCITAANVHSCVKSPDYMDVSEETHVIQYRLSKESMAVYVDGVGQGVILYNDIPGIESCRDGEGYYNVDNIIAPDFWGGCLKRLLCTYVNEHCKVYYDYSHKKHSL